MSQLWSPSSPTNPVAPAPAPATAGEKYPGRRIAQIIKLRPECIAEYKKVHAAVWPEVLKQIKDCNIVDCPYSPLSVTHQLCVP